MKRIYLDYAATTPVDPKVVKAMSPFLTETFGNPGSIHAEGVAAKKALEKARGEIARVFEVQSNELIFTGSGTEANNLALFGTYRFLVTQNKRPEKMHMITSTIEHPSILEPMKALETEGVKVTYVSPNEKGEIDPQSIKAALRPETVLVSIQYANGEIGTIQRLREIGEMIKTFRAEREYPYFHSDASQAIQFLPSKPNALHLDMLTADAQKIYGPKGVGVLLKNRRVKISPIILGGGQEQGLRAGTEQVSVIVGFAKALEIASEIREKEAKRLTALRDYTMKKILEIAPDAELNGATEKRLPNNINFSFPGIDSEYLVIKLDSLGFALSTKSTCLGSDEPYVITALGKSRETAFSSIRITLGRATSKKDIDGFIAALAKSLDFLKKQQ